MGKTSRRLQRQFKSGEVGDLMDTEAVVRFWEKVDEKDTQECWEWTAYCNRDGYGQFYLGIGNDGKAVLGLAPRVVWEIEYGVIPNKMRVLHCCDNPRCVNPGHLFLGTDADNVHDMRMKGRFRFDLGPARKRLAEMPNCRVLGERHPAAKLTEEKVRRIRRLAVEGTSIAKLARQFGVGWTCVSKIVNRQTWTHVG